MRTHKSITIHRHKTPRITRNWCGFGRCCAIAFAAVLAVLLSLGVKTPNAATPQLGGQTTSNDLAERGRQVMRALVGRQAVLNDDVVRHYLEGVVARLRSASDVPVPETAITVFRDTRVNAFVLPGGYIGVNAGLILEAPNESALASVLAHELAHLTQQHITRRFADQRATSLTTLAAMVAGVLVARDNPTAGQAAIYSGLANQSQRALDYSRAHEKEADRIGQALLAGAGFRSAGAAEMLQRMAALDRLNQRGDFEYLRTHPLTQARIGEAWERANREAAILARAGSTNAVSGIGDAARSVAFRLVQQRVAMLTAQAAVANAERAYFTGLEQLRDTPDATLASLAALAPSARDTLYARLLRAEALFRADQRPAARTAFDELQRDYPADSLVHTAEVRLLAEAGQFGAARDALNGWLKDQPNASASVLSLAARVNQQAGYLPESQRLLGEYHLATGDVPRALAAFNDALNAAEPGSDLHAVVAARLAALNPQGSAGEP